MAWKLYPKSLNSWGQCLSGSVMSGLLNPAFHPRPTLSFKHEYLNIALHHWVYLLCLSTRGRGFVSTFIRLASRNVDTPFLWLAWPRGRSLMAWFCLAFFFFFSLTWMKTAELVIQFNVTWHRKRADFLDERVWIHMSLGGLEQWSETSKIHLIRTMEFSIQSEIFMRV